MRYSGTTPDNRRQMLETIGVPDVEALLKTIPADIRVEGELDIAGPWPEADLKRRLEKMKGRRPRISLAGAGLYSHYIPDPVHSLCARSEWVTSYTPYQPELAQGTLAMYYEFQTYIAMLTGQEIANAGLYDGSTALVEGVLMAMRVNPRAEPVVYVSAAVHPEYVAVLETYMGFVGVEVRRLPIDGKTGRTIIDVAPEEQKKAVAVVVQSPNFRGVIEDLAGVDPDAMTIGVCTEALSMALLPPLPVKIAVGECQSFGIPIQLGGPTAGFFATRKDWVRKLPGRLVGRTIDQNGDEAYCITLATREQFIRREKATSNICTSSGLMCLRATVYLSLLGRAGLERLATRNAATARFFAKGLAELGMPLVHSGPFFNEFTIDAAKHPALYRKLQERDIVFGTPLAERESASPEAGGRASKHLYLIATTELHYHEAQSILQEVNDVAHHS